MLDRKSKTTIIPELKDEMFLTNQIDMRFYPDIFKIEFKQVNQQVDRIDNEKNNTLIINRRSIALTPLMMKQFVGIVNNILANYEKQHGEIKIPKMPKQTQKKEVIKTSGEYIG